METLMLIGLIVSFVLGIIIVNSLFRIYMKLMDVDFMYFSTKKKLIYTIIVGGAIWVLILKIFFKIG